MQRWVAAVAATLRAERGVAGFGQAALARRAGISRSSYRLYEEATRNPDVLQLAQIAEALGVPFSHLMAEIDRRASVPEVTAGETIKTPTRLRQRRE